MLCPFLDLYRSFISSFIRKFSSFVQRGGFYIESIKRNNEGDLHVLSWEVLFSFLRVCSEVENTLVMMSLTYFSIYEQRAKIYFPFKRLLSYIP